MTQAQRPERRTPDQWSTLVKEYEASGQSQRRFCAERGIGQSTLRYWRRRLEESGISSRRIEPRLVPVRVFDDGPSPAGSGLTLVVRDGLRIELAPEFDNTTLQRLLAAVGTVA